MSEDQGSTLLNRFLAERTEAHRRYNDALTALDRAIQSLPAWPATPPPYDERKLPDINQAWPILPAGAPPRPSGWRGAVYDTVWPLIAPLFERQAAFNAAVVEHLNRNAGHHRDMHAVLATALSVAHEAGAALVRFESLLVQFLQQITPLADAHYREIDDALAQLQTVTSVAQRTAMSAQREIERRGLAASAPGARPTAAPPEPADTQAVTYVGFEDRFRGSEEEIRARLADYAPLFVGQSDVLDVGCGRGEFLDLLRQQGVAARGLDLNAEMVEVCRSRGLEATQGDARGYLSRLPDASLGGLIAVQVIEHLEPAYLSSVIALAYDKLRPGARLVFETINPACWVAFFESFIRDLSHVKPIHPETLQFLLQANGFANVEIAYRSPIGEGGRLQKVTPRPAHFGETSTDAMTELVSSFNSNVDRLNGRLFSFQDYAAIATRP
jgi:O-antigen chain-terminating methyltransferase